MSKGALPWSMGRTPVPAAVAHKLSAPAVHCLSKDDCGSSVERTAKLHPLWRCLRTSRELFVMDWDGCGPGLDVVGIVDSRPAGYGVRRFARELPADQ